MRTDFGNFIDGHWVDPVSGETFESRNPADRTEVLGTFARARQRMSIGRSRLRRRLTQSGCTRRPPHAPTTC